MIFYFRINNNAQAIALARAFDCTVVDADGVERITSTHEASCIDMTVATDTDGGGEPTDYRRVLVIEPHTAGGVGIANGRGEPQATPVGHRMA